MGIQKYLREISTRYTASSIIGLDINKCLSLFMLVIILFTGCILALNGSARCLWTTSLAGEFSATEWNFESRAAPGLQYHGQGEELLHLTRAKTTKVWLLKFSGALRFTLSWLVPASWILVEQVSREGMGRKATNFTPPFTHHYFVRRLSPPVLTRLPLRFRFFRFDKRKNKVCYSSL